MKKIPFKKIGYALLIILALIQLYHPAGNNGEALSANDITHTVNVPDSVMKVLQTSCYDCHSNHTNYPWYHMIQPIGFWLDDHVNEGKRELNFSEYNTFKIKRQFKKLKKISKEVKENGMPLSSYTFIHHDAILTETQRQLLINWADSASLTIHIPDSLSNTK
jgi:Haem-binding domain